MTPRVFGQSSVPRPGAARPTSQKPVRPATKKSSIPSNEEGSAGALPRTTRPPAGRIQAQAIDESADSADGLPVARPHTQPKQGPASRAQPAVGQPRVTVKPVSQEMRQLLEEWEAKTKDIQSLQCPITRYEFDSVFAKETRSIGMIYFENPDRGRIDFEPASDLLLGKPAGRQDDKGKPFKVYPGDHTRWICTGKIIYIQDMANKQYDRVQIPPHLQGQNITRSPLPFIFGMKADDAISRFALRFGDLHNPDGTKQGNNGKAFPRWLHIVANPFDPNVAREYTQAEILLDPDTFRPMNLRTKDPSGNKETVYSFDQQQLKEDVSWTLRSPFKDPVLLNWQLMHDVKAESEQLPIRQTQERPSASRERSVER